MRIENWVIVPGNVRPFQAPESVSKHVHGNVYGNPNFPDGVEVTTSAIQKITCEGEKTLVHTKNSVYELGKVSEDYERVYPNATERVRGNVQA